MKFKYFYYFFVGNFFGAYGFIITHGPLWAKIMIAILCSIFSPFIFIHWLAYGFPVDTLKLLLLHGALNESPPNI